MILTTDVKNDLEMTIAHLNRCIPFQIKQLQQMEKKNDVAHSLTL